MHQFLVRSLALLTLASGCAAEPPASELPEPELAQEEAVEIDGTVEAVESLDPRVHGPKSVAFRAEAVIDADPSDVWEVITDYASYPAWNPWVVRAVGGTEPGDEVDVDVMMGTNKMAAKHIVLNGKLHERFCWKDAGWNALFVYAQRCRTLTVLPDGQVHYQVELLVDGAMSHLVSLFYGQNLRDGLAKETPALKARAEQLAGTAP